MHEKARPFICHMCNCTFSQRGNLRAHMRKVHVPLGENEKSFTCEECSCVFRKLATLNNHIARMHTVTQQQVSPVRITLFISLNSKKRFQHNYFSFLQ